MKKLLIVVCLTISISFLLACTRNTADSSKENGTVLARVNNTNITAKDVRDELGMLPPEVMRLFQEEDGTETLLKELVKKEMLYQEARKKGLQNTGQFRDRLDMLKKRLIVEMLLEEEIEKKAAVSEQEVKDFYEENKKRFEAEMPGNGGTGIMEFDVVKDAIRQRLTAEKQRRAFDNYIEELTGKYAVEMYPDAVEAAFGNRPSSESP